MADVKWIKITTDIFDDDKILLIESMPDADAIITIWFKILCLAGKQNNGGVFLMNNRIAYTDEMLATIFRRKPATVKLALQVFEQFGMIETIDGVITIPKWGVHQSIDRIESRNEYMKNYMREYRSKQAAIVDGANSKVNGKVNVSALEENREDKSRKDKSIERETRHNRHKYGSYDNVLLTDDEFQKVKDEFPLDYTARIERLSEYIASTGKVYKNHLATIRSWAKRDKEQKVEKKTVAKSALHNFDERNTDYDALVGAGGYH